MDLDAQGAVDASLADEPLDVDDDPYADDPIADGSPDPLLPADGTADAGWIGPPVEGAAEHWHEQERGDTCAVVSQEFILDDFTGIDHSEAELQQIAEANGWYTPGGGTAPDDVGKILEYHGIPVEQQNGATLSQLEQALTERDGVIVGVDSSEMWSPGFDPDEPLDNYPGVPGQGADHAVQVIGLDYSDPARPTAVLNDPGVPDGQATEVPLNAFLEAWEDTGYYLVTAHRPATATI